MTPLLNLFTIKPGGYLKEVANVIQYASAEEDEQEEVNVVVNEDETGFFDLPDNGLAVLEDLGVVATFSNYEPEEGSNLKPNMVYELRVTGATTVETDVEVPEGEDEEDEDVELEEINEEEEE